MLKILDYKYKHPYGFDFRKNDSWMPYWQCYSTLHKKNIIKFLSAEWKFQTQRDAFIVDLKRTNRLTPEIELFIKTQ